MHPDPKHAYVLRESCLVCFIGKSYKGVSLCGNKQTNANLGL